MQIDEEKAKEEVDSFLSGGIVNYILVYLAVSFVIQPVVNWITETIQSFIGKSVVGKLIKK